jgi:hypothetical protein
MAESVLNPVTVIQKLTAQVKRESPWLSELEIIDTIRSQAIHLQQEKIEKDLRERLVGLSLGQLQLLLDEIDSIKNTQHRHDPAIQAEPKPSPKKEKKAQTGR